MVALIPRLLLGVDREPGEVREIALRFREVDGVQRVIRQIESRSDDLGERLEARVNSRTEEVEIRLPEDCVVPPILYDVGIEFLVLLSYVRFESVDIVRPLRDDRVEDAVSDSVNLRRSSDRL